jgi:general L-amino acid transport system permease protein
MTALRQYFATPMQSFLSSLVLLLAAAIAVWALDWLVVEAIWRIAAPSECRTAAGACWPFLSTRVGNLIYGYYPPAERWRPDIAFALAALMIAWLLARQHKHRGAATALAIIVPVMGGILLFGGMFGLEPVPPSQFGGLLLTLLTSLFAIVTGLPLGIGLALMRTSKLPVLRVLASIWIEVWRGVPTVLALFLAVTVFPLLAPHGLEIDKLIRALLVFTVLTSALFAEAVRGGLNSVGDGQPEAATSLGLSRWQGLRLIVLPQALGVAIPNIVNVCVALIKETTLILVVGLYDLFGIVQTMVVDPQWAGGPVTATGYLAAAFGFWVICFSLSRLSRRFERRLRRDSRAA